MAAHGGPKGADPERQELKDDGFRELFGTIFNRWDANGDGKLDLQEINAAIDSPSLTGNAAAVAAALRRHIPAEEANQPRLITRAQAMALAANPQVQRLASRMVRLFNPWGDHVKPSGPAGLANGYPTEHGIFDVPLADFPEIFAGLEYETDR